MSYQNEPKFNDDYLRSNLSKLKDGAYVINLDEYKSVGPYWIALYVNSNNRSASYDATYFDSFGNEPVPKEIKKFIGNTNIIINIYRILPYKSSN